MGAAWPFLGRCHSGMTTMLGLHTHPFRQWLLVALVLIPYFSIYRCVSLSAMLDTFADQPERTFGTKTTAILLGFVEDVALVMLLLILLSGVDYLMGPRSAWAMEAMAPPRASTSPWTKEDSYEPDPEAQPVQTRTVVIPRHVQVMVFAIQLLRRVFRLVFHTALFVFAIAPFATDMLLLRIRNMRFTFEFVHMYLREINFTSDFAVDPYEVKLARQTVAISLTVVLALLLMSMMWFDFTRWHLAHLFRNHFKLLRPVAVQYQSVQTDVVPHDLTRSSKATAWHSKSSANKHMDWRRIILVVSIPLVLWTTLCTVLLLITHAIPAVVSATALNNSLNELFRTTTKLQFLKSLGDGTIATATDYIETSSESYELFQDDVLYRKTTGFHGPRVFDVAVNASNPPNVLVLVVESFRFQDSKYLVGNASKPLLQRLHNVTLTPHFDRWAQRGVAFRNMWSSWQTSRSLESILFGQVPYDHITDTGTSGGHRQVKLNGMPQLFHQKGYETLFTTGAEIIYDQWNKFLPSHGFDTVLSVDEFKTLAETTKHISKSDWKDQGREFAWGVHDDLALDILGDILYNKTLAQQTRMDRGEAKTPFFVNHYTISSHTPFRAVPAWFEDQPLAQLRPFSEEQQNDYDMKMYARVRYFTDLAIGKFLDRMASTGVLNDTIVVIVGDHGQSPEQGLSKPDVDQTSTTRVAAALIAEGRLGNATGMIIDDATEHTDWLNTLADITGVPDGGFLQSGVGRSLLRAIPFGTRPVWTNNPKMTLAVVKAHRRLRFDRVFSMMQLYDIEADPKEEHDLLPSVNDTERREWEMLREQGRRVSRYFRVRWDHACISKVKC